MLSAQIRSRALNLRRPWPGKLLGASQGASCWNAPVHRSLASPIVLLVSTRGVSGWWRGSSGGDGKDGGKGSGSSRSEKKDNAAAGEGEEKVVIVEGKSGGQSDALTKVGPGDSAPRHPHVLALPITRRPFFPGLVQAVNITSPKVFEAISSIKQDYGHYYIGCFLRKEEPAEGSPPEVITDMSQIHSVGTLTQVQNTIPLGMGGQVVLVSHRRIKIDGPFAVGPPLRVKVSHLEGLPYDADSMLIKALSNEVVATIRELIKVNPLFKEHFNFYTQKIDVVDPFRLADFAATLSTGEAAELQDVLEELDAEKRLNKALLLIKKELELGKLQQEIQQQVEAKISQKQREYFLMEQLKYIKKELGMEKDDKEALLTKFKDRIKDLIVPKVAKQAIDEELEKLEALEKNSSEFNVTRNYLEWLTSLPWGITTPENFDLKRAKTILDEDHYGLNDIKDRILEFMAVSKLKGSTQGKILCFVGPPGVGKTSIGKSIARALNREFYRFSVGGLYDVAEIKGHRRTYVGAMPGKIIQCLKTVGTSNPLVLIDEVDKLGRDRGDPASALLELLDPNQNESFIDHYLDVPVDVSKVLFICTANLVDTIPGPLQDRMEIIRLSGYDLPEKVAIAKQYLIPKARAEAGIAQDREDVPKSVGIAEEAIDSLVRWYCREAGVRNLEKHIEKVCRKLALEVIHRTEGDEQMQNRDDWLVTDKNLDKYVGKRVFTSDRLYERAPPPGVVMGLSWTAMGGASLYIEVQSVRHKSSGGGTLSTTGQMGRVMEESTRIAHTFARRKLEDYQPDNSFFDTHDLHMHVPEGSIPKEGPSAGITMTTALLSLALGRPTRPDVAMTGEISLTGLVLPVGGIKEKTIAARRSGVKCLVFPVGNKRDFDELPQYLKEGLEVHFATTYDDVFNVAFSDESWL